MIAPRSGPWTVTLLLVFVALCVPCSAIAAQSARVLLLHSFGQELAPYDLAVAEFRSEFAQGSSEPVALYDASLDAEEERGPDIQESFLELLHQRFAGSPPDVVVTIGPPRCRLLSAKSG
jgi:hypothetical protein